MDFGDLQPRPITANDVGMDAGAAGALGANNGLQQLIAMRLFRDQLAEAQRRYDAEQARTTRLDAQNARRLDQADARQGALDARTERSAKDAENKAMLAQVTQFPGTQVTGAQLAAMGVGPTSPLRGTQFKNLQEALGGTFLTGMSGTAGTPQQAQGQITPTAHAAIGPDQYEVRPTFTDEMKSAAADLAQRKADITEAIANAKTDAEREHWKAQLGVMEQRIGLANDRANQKQTGLDANQALTQTRQLAAEYMKDTQADRTILENAGTAIKNYNTLTQNPNIKNRTAYETGIVDNVIKTFNPNGIVRQQTADRYTKQGQSFMDAIYGRAQKIRDGGVGMTNEDLHDFIGALAQVAGPAKDRYLARRAQTMTQIGPYAGTAANQINPEAVMDKDSYSGVDLSPFTSGGPAIGAERTINGQPAVWDGHGWVAK